MKRSGFKRKEYQKAPRPTYAPMPPDVAARVSMGPAATVAMPKDEQDRNPHLLAMAKGKPCLVLLPGCDGGGASGTTVAAHSNQARHGKGAGRKANDQYTAWACFNCHSAIDQGSGSKEEKFAAWDLAHKRQVRWWALLQDAAKEPRDQAAARWALRKLGVGCMYIEDFPPGTPVVTPTGLMGTVVKAIGAESKGDPCDRLLVRTGPGKWDTVQLQPALLRRAPEQEMDGGHD